MVRKLLRRHSMRRIANVSARGLAIFFLAGLAISGAQQRMVSPGTPPADSHETNTRPSPTNTQKPLISDYTVSPDDLLEVEVMGVPEITRTYRVSSNGFLTLPLLAEPIPATGQTLDQLQNLIAAKFREAGMLNNAIVTVSLRETRNHTVLVSGEVAHPQNLPIYGTTRLLDVLIQAGGLTANAGNEAVIIR